MRNRVIVLEFNELTPSLMDRFIGEGRLPNFARLREESHAYVTDAEEQPPNLEPWIQWVTVHTGLSFKQHGIFDLGDGHKLGFPSLWDVACAAGKKVWICGSMNAGARPPVNGFVLPDPWSTGIEAHPSHEFDAYMKLVRRYVQEYTRDRVPLSRREYLGFIGFMLRHGLSPRTVAHTVAQLLGELRGRSKWKRATILDRLQWDVFCRYYRKHDVDFATFFVNSTAHFQHFYWRNMDPARFTVKPTEQDQKRYADAILYGYRQMDEIVGECIKLAGRDATIVLATALSQQPFLTYESTQGKRFYRPRDFRRLMELAGVPGDARHAPVMSEQFHVYFDNEDDAVRAESCLKGWRVGDREAMMVRRNGTELFAGCCVFAELPRDARLVSASDGKEFGFYDLFYLVDGTKSGAHHPDGIFWVRTPDRSHEVAQGKVSLRQVAPTILSLLNLQKPGFMTSDPLPFATAGQSVPARSS